MAKSYTSVPCIDILDIYIKNNLLEKNIESDNILHEYTLMNMALMNMQKSSTNM